MRRVFWRSRIFKGSLKTEMFLTVAVTRQTCSAVEISVLPKLFPAPVALLSYGLKSSSVFVLVGNLGSYEM